MSKIYTFTGLDDSAMRFLKEKGDLQFGTFDRFKQDKVVCVNISQVDGPNDGVRVQFVGQERHNYLIFDEEYSDIDIFVIEMLDRMF